MSFKYILAVLCAAAFLSPDGIPDSAAQTGSTAKPRLGTVVIDAGHGGKDAGCVSKDGRTYEKNLTLAIAKQLGQKIKAAYPEVKVYYTRLTDRYLTLNERADIANRNNADLFISIHINSNQSSSPSGFSSHIFGRASGKDSDLFRGNMDLCRRENSVILLEDDYTTKYQGFDPNDPESFIFFSLMQNAYYEQSLLFAGEVVQALEGGPITKNRGVSQDSFFVLWKTAMPAVLLELGFISNSSDLKTMRSSSGQDAIAQRMFNAFRSFKTKYDGSLDYAPEGAAGGKQSSPAGQGTSSPEGTFYGVQIFALGRLLPEDDESFRGYDAVAVKSGGIYKYVIRAGSIEEARACGRRVKDKFPGAFPVKVNGSSVTRL